MQRQRPGLQPEGDAHRQRGDAFEGPEAPEVAPRFLGGGSRSGDEIELLGRAHAGGLSSRKNPHEPTRRALPRQRPALPTVRA
ncbi:MAG: hypothetical protein M5U26_10090 [Planctomycetota bacterium]|nr:hypothetical protein [Planctomycetota bacterium]